MLLLYTRRNVTIWKKKKRYNNFKIVGYLKKKSVIVAVMPRSFFASDLISFRGINYILGMSKKKKNEKTVG